MSHLVPGNNRENESLHHDGSEPSNPGNNTPGSSSHASGQGGEAHSGNNPAGDSQPSQGIQQAGQGEQQPSPWQPTHDGLLGEMETNVHGTKEALSKAKETMSNFLSGDA